MVYAQTAHPASATHFELDSTESVWYSPAAAIWCSMQHFEVDSTESVWYSSCCGYPSPTEILKLTPQSQYGILQQLLEPLVHDFEVDSTESVWYNISRSALRRIHFEVDSTESVWYRYRTVFKVRFSF